MKKTLILILILDVIGTLAQSPFNFQARVNLVPINQFYYAGAFRMGAETIGRKWNFGMDYLGYIASRSKDIKYSQDTLFHRTVTERVVNMAGLAVNVMRTIDFKNNNNKLILGLQGFGGWTHQNGVVSKSTLDTMHIIPYPGHVSAYDWHNDWGGELHETPVTKIAMGIGAFVRLQLEISKRFTFSPELMLPVVFSNFGSGFSTNFTPGFNFCVGYRFGKK